MSHLGTPKASFSGEVTRAMGVPLALLKIGFALIPFGIVLRRKRLLVKAFTLGVSHYHLFVTLHPSFILSICFFVHSFYLKGY